MADTRFVILPKPLAYHYRGCISFWSQSKKDFCSMDTAYIDKWPKITKMFPKLNQRQFVNIVTGDETFWTSKKNENRRWLTLHGRRHEVAKNIISAKKVLYCIFFLCDSVAVQIPVSNKNLLMLYQKRSRNISKNDALWQDLTCLYTIQLTRIPYLTTLPVRPLHGSSL